MRLNREHPNRAVFEPQQGLDPTLDVSLVGTDFKILVQGRASVWQVRCLVRVRTSWCRFFFCMWESSAQ